MSEGTDEMNGIRSGSNERIFARQQGFGWMDFLDVGLAAIVPIVNLYPLLVRLGHTHNLAQ